MDGIINIFKPKGMTSHDVVKELRRILSIKKIGHTGTLDPNATGVLPVCIGKGTRISEYLLNVHKEYIGELTLGIATDTQDSDGKIISYSNKKVGKDEIYSAFNSFIGEIEQIPPMYSALKYNGKKLYELARKGEIIERVPRKVHIYDLNIMKIHDNKVIFYVKCSRGTYIRTLCDDIGNLLGTYGYMSHLIRVGVGDFKINDSISLDYIRRLDKKDIKSILCPIDDGLSHLDSLNTDDKYFKPLINGALLPMKNIYNDIYTLNTPIRVYSGNAFIGVGRLISKDNVIYIKMDKVLI